MMMVVVVVFGDDGDDDGDDDHPSNASDVCTSRIVWFWALVNVTEAGLKDKKQIFGTFFLQLANYNAILILVYFSFATYYAFQMGKASEGGTIHMGSSQMWLPRVVLIVYQTTWCISVVLTVFFWISEYPQMHFTRKANTFITLTLHFFVYV